MKTFILASAIFLLILIFVITSAIFLVKFGRELKSIAEDFPADLLTEADSYQTTLQTFKNTFNEKRFFIHLTIGHSENESIENALRDLEARYKNGDPSGYASARSRLISAIERIIDAESLSLYTVF
jgi:hypothetical protein